ncbi:MAG: hypothetical protein IH897_04430, partial [Planctomycetes bacterium]|nr:hypothetical protein [Planctomycetota bacterium]
MTALSTAQLATLRIQPRQPLRILGAAAALWFIALPPQDVAAQPAKPTNLKAIPNYANNPSIELSWTRNSNDETHFELYREDDNDVGVFALLFTTPGPNILVHIDTT